MKQQPTRMRCPATEWYELHMRNLKSLAGAAFREHRAVYIALCFAFCNKLTARWIRDDFAAWYRANRSGDGCG